VLLGELVTDIPLLAEEGWRDSLIEAGAPGAKREPDRAKPQVVVSSAKHFSRSDHPVCAFAPLGASTPPLRGGECSRRGFLASLVALGASGFLPPAKRGIIDVHHHIGGGGNWSPDRAVEEMDRNGIATGIGYLGPPCKAPGKLAN